MIFLSILVSNSGLIVGMDRKKIVIPTMLVRPKANVCTLNDGSIVTMNYMKYFMSIDHETTHKNSIIKKTISFDNLYGIQEKKSTRWKQEGSIDQLEIGKELLMAILVKNFNPLYNTQDAQGLIKSFLKKHSIVIKASPSLLIKKKNSNKW